MTVDKTIDYFRHTIYDVTFADGTTRRLRVTLKIYPRLERCTAYAALIASDNESALRRACKDIGRDAAAWREVKVIETQDHSCPDVPYAGEIP